MENNKVEICFRTRSYCTIDVPENLKTKKEIRKFIMNKLIRDDFENVDKCVFEGFEIIE